MTRPLLYSMSKQIRFDDETWEGILEYVRYVKVQTGAKITDSDAVRVLVREALISRKIIEENDSP